MDEPQALTAPPESDRGRDAVPGLPDLPAEHADALLDLLLRTAGAGVALFDRELRFVRVNARMAEINLLPVSAHFGRRLAEVVPGGTAGLEAVIRGVLESGAPVTDVELSGEYPAGRPRTFTAGYFPLHVGGRVAGVLAVVQETTERRRAEDALRDQGEMLSLLVDNIAQTFYVDDAAGNTLYVSPAYAGMFGRSAESLYADPRSFLASVHPDDRARIEAAIPRARTGTLDLHYRIVRPDGTVRRVRDRLFPVFGGDGRVVRSAGIVEDVTLEHEVLETERLLAEAGQVLSASLDLDATLRRTVDLLVPRFGDFCVVMLKGEDGVFRAAAWRHADTGMEARLDEMMATFHPLPGDGTHIGAALATGEPAWVHVTPEHVASVAAVDPGLRLAATVRPASSVIAPLAARGETVGVMLVSMATQTGRRHTEAEYRALREVAHRAALALENARLYQAEQHARHAAEEAAGRVARLQALTAALSGAMTAADVGRVVLERGLEVFGAYAGGVAVVTEDGAALELIATAGYPEGMTRPFARVPLDSGVPMARAARTRGPVLVDEASTGYPAMERTAARLALPLAVDQRVVGTLALSFEIGQAPGDAELAFFATVAQQCAQALDRVRLHEAGQRARAASEAAERRASFLAETSRLLAATLDAEETLEAVARAAVPGLADWCAVDLVGDPDSAAWPPVVRRVVVAHQDPAKVEWARRLAERNPPHWSADAGLPRVLRTGEPAFHPAITDNMLVAAARDPEHLALLREVGFSSLIIVPLVARGRTLGAITLCHTESGRRYDEADLAMAGSLARRAGAALDNARLYGAEQAARAAAETAAERTRRLQSITAALAQASTPAGAARAVLEQGIAALGATAGGLSMLTPAGDALELVAIEGFTMDTADRNGWLRFPLNAPLAACEAVRRREVVFLRSLDEWRLHYPIAAELMQRSGLHAYAVAPLEVEGRALGALGFNFRDAREFTAEDEAFVTAIARQAAQALERARLFAAEHDARAAAERSAAAARRLQGVTAALSEAATPREVAEVIVVNGAEALGAAGGSLALLEPGTAGFRMLASTGYPESVAHAYEHFPVQPGRPVSDAVLTGTPVLLETVDEVAARFPGVAEALRATGFEAYAAIPIYRGDIPLAGLSFSFRGPHRFSGEERAFLRTLAGQAGQALERSRLYEAERAARAAAEAAAARALRLQRLAADLSEAATPADVARVVVDHGAAELGADTAKFATLSADGTELETLAMRGFGPAAAARWARFPVVPGRPLSDAVLTRRPVLISTPDEVRGRYPEAVGLAERERYEAYAAVPVSGGDRVLGGLSFGFRRARELGADQRTFLLTLAELASQAFERARAYEAERHARADAEGANRAKTEFLAVMSHELRTPLNAIAGYAELMAMGIRGPVTPEQAEDLGRIQRSQRHLLGLINDVLNFARIEAGRVELHLADVGVDAALAEVESLVAPQLRERGLVYRYLGADPRLRVRADAEKLRQVLLNVLSNAVKFTSQGGSVTLEAHAAADAVHVRVTDTGMGIPPDRLESIFEPFVQLGRNLTSRHEGTGLGLAISRDLARAMGGDLAAASTVGSGSTFTLTLPRSADGEA
ncbi:GAF domain-containing protein [Longimicrobium sp.]|uniref:GAF domain-containing protein n=1 Tax=Longimicrobium sp. TaxID=2029185 RepID=UPI002B62E6DC|nr:GAF domain-containing protein [Longimicrobium sp.]HSU14017.1 GAF domain-containing protein [Longimicrobium sp.]